MFALGRNFPQLLTGLKLDVSKLSIRIKPIQILNHGTNLLRCRVGYVTTKTSSEDTSNITQHKENTQEISNEKLIQKVNEVHEN